jgi:hypothetical protein
LLRFCSVALGSSSCGRKGDVFICMHGSDEMRCRVKEKVLGTHAAHVILRYLQYSLC